MFRKASCTLLLLTLAACGGGGKEVTVDPVGAQIASETPPDLVAVAQALDARRGQKISDHLTVLSASARGQTLAMNYAHDRPDADFSQAERESYAISTERTIAQQMCAQPATRKFVETYGGIAVNIVTSDRQPLANFNITTC
ncbi:hypothetical protein [Palleronia caenipelagi]|uniref:Uncharacterized protein n=1 Tax=Palleronia caenipelagi TaxID=2489174 RepID=A0A547Q5B0_9RHOB|nr:hypothetical protein [Palleronia caenipelagi]TRD21580.1 hypothetical protein FEV53_08860 [Palleronia caenipelagi]